jgi:beta-glucosidase
VEGEVGTASGWCRSAALSWGGGSPFEEVRASAYGEWLAAIRRSGDFTRVQTYRQVRIPGSGPPLPPLPTLPFTEPGDRMAELQRPEALGNTVEYVHAETKKPVLVTENGLETDDDERGVTVLGYLHWSLIDNFEWIRGYAPKMGLTSVDRTTFERTPKPSASHLGDIACRNGL